MRIRTIKPEFWESESLSRVSRDARLLFIGLFNCCDDSGRTRASSRILASRIFPYDDDAKQLLPRWMDELEREKCIRRYVVDGETYLEIPKWLAHQKIDRPSQSKLPEFVASSWPPREDSRNVALDQGSGNREGEQGTGSGLASSGGAGPAKAGGLANGSEREHAPASEPPDPKPRFKPPTREELNLEAAKIGLPDVEVDKFAAYYGANGWRVGKVPMKSWPHALAGWAARWRENHGSRNTRTGAGRPTVAEQRNAIHGPGVDAHVDAAWELSRAIDAERERRMEEDPGYMPFGGEEPPLPLEGLRHG